MPEPRQGCRAHRSAGTRHAVAGALVSAAIGWGSNAHAVNFEVTGDVAAQGYEVASPWGDRVVGRRRLMSMVGLSAYNLQGDHEPLGPDYSVRMRMRLDADFGMGSDEYTYNTANTSRFGPGLSVAPVDVMYGYVEGRNLAGGWFGFRAGRQYVTDVLGWWSFDGGLLRLTPPYFFKVEAYGGLEQRGGLPLSTSRFEQQGVWRGDHRNFESVAFDYPSYQFAAAAPAFGFAVESDGPNWLHGRFSYRRVYNSGDAFTQQFPSPAGGGVPKVSGLRYSQERLGYAASVFLAEIGGIKGGFSYDLYNQLLNKGYAGVDVHLGSIATLGADFDYYVPTFDADSIWNWFTHSPITTALGRVAVRPVEGLDLTGSGGVRLWMADGDPATYAAGQCAALGGSVADQQRCLNLGSDPSFGGDEQYSRDEANRGTTLAPDVLANLGSRYRWGTGEAGLGGSLQMGLGDVDSDRGRRVGGHLQGKQGLVNRQVWLGGRVSVYDWTDPLRVNRDATSFTYVVAPEYRPVDEFRARLEWEHSMNRLVGQRFRILAVANVRLGQ
jgi:hypothetical protein